MRYIIFNFSIVNQVFFHLLFFLSSVSDYRVEVRGWPPPSHSFRPHLKCILSVRSNRRKKNIFITGDYYYCGPETLCLYHHTWTVCSMFIENTAFSQDENAKRCTSMYALIAFRNNAEFINTTSLVMGFILMYLFNTKMILIRLLYLYYIEIL